jgi:hypothetical protein
MRPNLTRNPVLRQAFAQNPTIAIDTAKLLAGDPIQALNGELEHLKLSSSGVAQSEQSEYWCYVCPGQSDHSVSNRYV